MLMQLKINNHILQPKSFSDNKEQADTIFVTDSFFAILLVLIQQFLKDNSVFLSALEISSKIHRAIKPETVSHLFWEYKKYEGIFFEKSEGYYKIIPNKFDYLDTQVFELNKWLKTLEKVIFRATISNESVILNKTNSKIIQNPSVVRGISSDLQRLEILCRSGRFDEAAKLIDRRGLNQISSKISGKARDELVTKWYSIYGALKMSEGYYVEANQILRKAESLARSTGNIRELLYVMSHRASALRMVNVEGVKEARKLYFDGLEIVKHHRQNLGSQIEYGKLYRWLNTNCAFMSTMSKDYNSALATTEEAIQQLGICGNEKFVGEIETRLRKSQILILQKNKLDYAEDEIQKAFALKQKQEEFEKSTGETHIQWYLGWIPRYQANLYIAQGKIDDAKKCLMEGWEANDGYGFQRIHILKKLSGMKKTGFDNDNLKNGLFILHKQFVNNSNPKLCPECKSEPAKMVECIINSRWANVSEDFWV